MRMRILLQVLTVLLLMTLPGRASDLSGIDRTIRKEPAYRDRPRYCLLVIGPQCETRIWLVIDGSTLYMDRNLNGDLTDPGEQIAATPTTSKTTVRFQVDALVEADGKTRYPGLWVDQYFARQRGHLVNSVGVLDVLDAHGQGVSGEQGFSFAATAALAPIVHCNGPLTLRVHSATIAHRGGFKLKEFPFELDTGERVSDLHVQVGTPGLGQGSFAALAIEKRFPPDLHPRAEISMPDARASGSPSRLTFFLKERC